MGRKYKNLYTHICNEETLWRAYQRAARGRRRSSGYLTFRENEAANIKLLAKALSDGSYAPSEPNIFTVYEPKQRCISALQFHDRVVQHALVSAIEPLFERTFLPQSHACRPGKGTHQGAVTAQATMRRMIKQGKQPWYLQIDFSAYFASIDRAILFREIRRKVSCHRTLSLLEMFHPPTGKGIPIGNLTSQLCANIYGHAFDRWLAHTVKPAAFIRYMDDTVIFGYTKEALHTLRFAVQWFCQARLKLNLSRWKVAPVSAGMDFLGYRIWPGYKLLRKRSVLRARRKIVRYRQHGQQQKLARFMASWRGHAQWANTHNLMTALEM